jgi:hypothetical protein
MAFVLRAALLQASEPKPTSVNKHVASLVRNSLADNTRRTYLSDLAHFERWGGKVPATDELIASYLAVHAEKASMATLQRPALRDRRTASTSRRTCSRYPSCFTSCTHPGPDGTLYERVGMQGSMKPLGRDLSMSRRYRQAGIEGNWRSVARIVSVGPEIGTAWFEASPGRNACQTYTSKLVLKGLWRRSAVLA